MKPDKLVTLTPEILNIDKLKVGQIVIGIDGTTKDLKSPSAENRVFFAKYNFSKILVKRGGKYTISSYQHLLDDDEIISLNKMEVPIYISEESQIKHLSDLGIKRLLVAIDANSLKASHDFESRQLTIDDFFGLEPTKIVRSPFKTRFQKNISLLLTELHQLQDEIGESEKLQEYGAELIENFFDYGNTQPFRMHGIEKLANKLCNSLSVNSKASSVLMMLKDHDDYTFRHCIDVANQLLFFLKYLGSYEEESLQGITLGALFHDIGKADVPREILNKPGKLTEEEWKIMKTHPIRSAKRMEKLKMNGLQINIGLMHHLRKDGSGYPENIDYEEAHEITRIVMIIDVFQALVTHRPYRQPDTPFAALKKIRSLSNVHFDSWLVDAFIRAFGVYPVGSFLKLSDGRYGFVISNDKYSLRPTMMISIDVNGQKIDKPELIDLADRQFDQLKILQAINHRQFFKNNEALSFFMNLDA